jgi:hypothetical protein
VIAGARLRAGKNNSGKGAPRMIAQAVATARAAGVTGHILVRGHSAYGNGVVVAACRRAGARFSLVLTKNRAVAAAIDALDEGAWTPVQYPGRAATLAPANGSLMPKSPTPRLRPHPML